MKKLWYSWEEMRRDVNSLCREIALDKFDPQVIVGISRGGLVPGVMMSHWFGIFPIGKITYQENQIKEY